MAKFRTNHSRQGRGRAGGPIRMLLLAGLMAGALVIGLRYIPVMTTTARPKVIPAAERFFLPNPSASTANRHFDFGTIGQDTLTGEIKWIAYPVFGFPAGSEWNDSSLSLVDPNDSWYIPEANRTNWRDSIVIPALPGWANDWKTLQTFTRDQASFLSPLYVTIAFQSSLSDTSSWDNQEVPFRFFKVLLDLEPVRAIGFEITQENPNPVAIPIDSIETWVGIDFFHEMLIDSLETKVESQVDSIAWNDYFLNVQ
jgi:hypothetical protein